MKRPTPMRGAPIADLIIIIPRTEPPRSSWPQGGAAGAKVHMCPLNNTTKASVQSIDLGAGTGLAPPLPTGGQILRNRHCVVAEPVAIAVKSPHKKKTGRHNATNDINFAQQPIYTEHPTRTPSIQTPCEHEKTRMSKPPLKVGSYSHTWREHLHSLFTLGS